MTAARAGGDFLARSDAKRRGREHICAGSAGICQTPQNCQTVGEEFLCFLAKIKNAKAKWQTVGVAFSFLLSDRKNSQ